MAEALRVIRLEVGSFLKGWIKWPIWSKISFVHGYTAGLEK